MSGADKPLLVLLGQVLPNRVAAFEALSREIPIEVVDLANDVPHGGGLVELPASVPQTEAGLRDIPGLIRSGRYRAVMIETQGPLSFPLAGWVAHRAGVPLIVWMGLQHVPRTPRWRVGAVALRRVLGWADVVISYGSAHAELARSLGAQRVISSIDPLDLAFWTEPVEVQAPEATEFLFAGRRELEKGPEVLVEAWLRSGLAAEGCRLRLVGGGGWSPSGGFPAGISVEEPQPREGMRQVYAAAAVLVVPSITTRTFKEPWGMVVGEAMCSGVAVIASDSVGAVSSGLAVDGETALIVPEGDPDALADAMKRLATDQALRSRLVESGQQRVREFDSDRWVRDMAEAIRRLEEAA